ncbi:MAG: hypothetical protein IPH08_10960 [Rhodocyclaceae bacterium]|nr:hypothetical protein [Rhodocyclaceae bacterium]
MTSASLLLWLVLGITLQIVLWLGISFWRHWGEYQALRTGAGADGGMAVPVKVTLPSASEPASVAAWGGFRNFRVDRKEIEDGAQSICSFYLVPEDKQPLPAFKPGQFLTFRLDVPAPDGKTEQITRCYSLSDAPRQDFYRVSIKRVPAPTGSAYLPGRSSNYFHDHVQVGEVLQVRAPGGHFHIDSSDAPVVLVGGGIGITRCCPCSTGAWPSNLAGKSRFTTACVTAANPSSGPISKRWPRLTRTSICGCVSVIPCRVINLGMTITIKGAWMLRYSGRNSPSSPTISTSAVRHR